MPKLTVPDEHRAAISRIKDFEEANVQALRTAIAKDPSLSIARPSSLLPVISGIVSENPKQIAEVISALYRVKSSRDVPIEEFADDLADAMGLAGGDKERLRNNVVTLLSIDEARLSAKALDLQTDDECSFCSARIITDLRPVFGDRISEGPKAMVLVHLLKVGYHRVGMERHQQFDLTLDASDLKELRALIERAEEKATSLKNSISSFRYLARS